MYQQGNTNPQKPKQQQQKQQQKQEINRNKLAILRSEYLRKLKIKVKPLIKTSSQNPLISIQTFDPQKNTSIQLIIRKLPQLDSLIQHINTHYGGHIIPIFKFNLYYYQNKLNMNDLVPAIQQYLIDLKHNKYCRQDVKFYCFILEQNTLFEREIGFQRFISSATDFSRRYLNEVFTRKNIPKQKNTDILLYTQHQLQQIIHQYHQLKQIVLLKCQQALTIQQLFSIFMQMSAEPIPAIQTQQHEIQLVCNAIVSCEKLIEQGKYAFIRWENLADKVSEFQNNVYKGLNDYQNKYRQLNQQLKLWSESLTQQFYDLCNYLQNKMQTLSYEISKINLKLIDINGALIQQFDNRMKSASKTGEEIRQQRAIDMQQITDHFETAKKQISIEMVSK